MPQISFHQAGQLTTLPPLSLYVHIPWCIQKCPYCDFNSHSIKHDWAENAYIDALLKDLETELPNIWGRKVETIFIGGGTPSLFEAASIDRLLSGIRARISVQPEAEITLEANPGTFEKKKFTCFRAAGVNRLSIGVQSFDDASLKKLGRIHNCDEALAAIDAALATFDRVNIDLMYALPQQTVDNALMDIQTAIDSGVSHISAYQLTMEPNTPFGHAPPKGLPSDDFAQNIEETIHQCLLTAGFSHYETSAFVKSQQQCRHNLNYWQFGDYIGIGAGAHGKISYPTHIERTTRRRHPSEYLNAMQTQPQSAINRHKIANDDLAFEFMMNALRLTEGIPASFLPERTGIHSAQIRHQLEIAQQKGLLDPNLLLYKPTELGQRFLNDLLQCFL